MIRIVSHCPAHCKRSTIISIIEMSDEFMGKIPVSYLEDKYNGKLELTMMHTSS